jgi:hypothetical protein
MPVLAERDDLTFLDDEELSWKAKGLLLAIVASPDEAVNITDLFDQSSCGSHATRTGIQELLDAGLIRRA